MKNRYAISGMLLATAIIFLIFLASCVTQETVVIKANKSDDATNAANNSLQNGSANSSENISDSIDESAETINESSRIPMRNTAKTCRADSDCGAESAIDHSRCWQRSVYTTFNQSKCFAGRCKMTQYDSITQLCNEETEMCMAGSCVPKPMCYQRGTRTPYSYIEASDGLGNKYGSFCETNRSLVQFFCNPETPEKIFNETISCSGGCGNGKCNPDQVILNNLS